MGLQNVSVESVALYFARRPMAQLGPVVTVTHIVFSCQYVSKIKQTELQGTELLSVG